MPGSMAPGHIEREMESSGSGLAGTGLQGSFIVPSACSANGVGTAGYGTHFCGVIRLQLVSQGSMCVRSVQEGK